jgi:HD-GYP domain-containing protein (c-di-GMP phosphodiesterase class II)
VALAIGSCFVALLLGFFGADRDAARRSRDAAEREAMIAAAFAERAGPWLERRDVLRLSVLAAVVRDQIGGRALLLDQRGVVVIDTALALGDRQLALLSTSGGFQRQCTLADGSPLRESLSPVRFGGDVIGEVRLQCWPLSAVASGSGIVAGIDLTWFGLALLSCFSLVAAAAVLGHYWSARVRAATDVLIRLAAGEVAGSAPAADEAELQDLGMAMRELERGMQDGLHRVGEGYLQMAQQVVDGLEQRRLAVPGHGERTARLAARLAERLQLLPEDRRDLEIACRLCDLGKASIRPSILQQPGQLTEVEARSLERHPERGADQLDCVPGLRRIAKILRHQAERYDGRGTPGGLRGDRIPLASRVLAIASAFDLLTTCGDEQQPLSWQDALRRIEKLRGDVFDPWLVTLFAEVVTAAPPSTEGDREVLIVPGGVMPWRLGPSGEGEADEESLDERSELEIMLDDAPSEDRP